MSDSSYQNAPLGIGAILGESAGLLFSNFLAACGIALIPIAIGTLISVAVFGVDVAVGQGPDPAAIDESYFINFGLTFFIELIAYSLATAMLVSFAYDVKLGRSKRLSSYVNSVIGNLLPLIVMAVVSYILIVIGLSLLILPGLWLYAVFSLIVPVIVVERAGFGAMGRSAELTKDYRWPIVGLLIVMFIVMFIISAIFGLIVGFISALVGGQALLLILNIVTSTVGFAFGCIMIALLYARLRELKEGISVDHLADVFS